MPEIKLIPLTEFETVNNSIKPARSIIPDWYKKSPQRAKGEENTFLTSTGISTSTYKQCAPFLDAMILGYMAVLTSDIEITIGENNLPFITHKRLDREVVTTHSSNQWEGMDYPLLHYPIIFKWQQQLVLKTPKNYSLVFTHPMNRLDLPFTTISGVVDSDNYNMPTHFPFWLKYGFTGVIEAGTPVCQIIPFPREKWKQTKENFNPIQSAINRDNYFSKIVKGYKTQVWKKKHYN